MCIDDSLWIKIYLTYDLMEFDMEKSYLGCEKLTLSFVAVLRWVVSASLSAYDSCRDELNQQMKGGGVRQEVGTVLWDFT